MTKLYKICDDYNLQKHRQTFPKKKKHRQTLTLEINFSQCLDDNFFMKLILSMKQPNTINNQIWMSRGRSFWQDNGEIEETQLLKKTTLLGWIFFFQKYLQFSIQITHVTNR